jgi:hypothetical protein
MRCAAFPSGAGPRHDKEKSYGVVAVLLRCLDGQRSGRRGRTHSRKRLNYDRSAGGAELRAVALLLSQAQQIPSQFHLHRFPVAQCGSHVASVSTQAMAESDRIGDRLEGACGRMWPRDESLTRAYPVIHCNFSPANVGKCARPLPLGGATGRPGQPRSPPQRNQAQ